MEDARAAWVQDVPDLRPQGHRSAEGPGEGPAEVGFRPPGPKGAGPEEVAGFAPRLLQRPNLPVQEEVPNLRPQGRRTEPLRTGR